MKNNVNNIFIFISFILLIIPISVNANIICNDGTESPTCLDCHTGCCSKHNGCTNNVNHYSSKEIIKNNNDNSYSLSFIDFILLLILIVPLLIYILKSLYDTKKTLQK